MSDITEKNDIRLTEDNQVSNLMSQSIDKIAAALSKAQAAIENVGKDKKGYGYKYADLASCLDAIKKPLADNGLSITQLVTQENGKPMLATLLMHNSGQWLKSVFPIENIVIKTKEGKDTGNVMQQMGAGITYCRRYALSAIIGLAQEDDDAQCLSSITKEPVKQKVNWANPVSQADDPIALSKELQRLCEENDIKSTEFATVFAISSKDKDSVRNAVQNFDSMKEDFKQMTRVES